MFNESYDNEAPFIAPRSELMSNNNEAQEEQIVSNDQEKEEVKDESAEAQEEQVVSNDQEPDASPSVPTAPPTTPATPGVVAPPTVSIGHVNSTTSPAGMPDRIPPRVDTNLAVAVSGYSIPQASVTFSIEGANAANGNATINGSATAAQNSNGNLKLRGTTQTAPGSAGNLKVVAKQGSTVLARSNSFSVSSIPQNFSVSIN